MAKADTTLNGTDLNPMNMHVAPFDLGPVIAANQRGFQAAAEAQAHMMKRLTALNRELTGFISRRLTHDREAAKELSRCQTPQDAVAVCAKFAETAMKDYSEELGTIMGAYAEQAQEIMQDVQYQAEQTIDTAPGKGT